jgi:superfamily II DNA or RNA helicase
MEIIIRTPSKAYLSNYTLCELDDIKKQLTYTNTSISFNIKKLKGQRWFREKNPEAYEARLAELQKSLKTTLVFEDENGFYIRPGSISYLKNIQYTVTNEVFYQPYKAIAWKHKPNFEPYPYQDEGYKKLIDIKHGNISCGTGLGKTYIIELITRNMGLPTIIITPSQAIFSQVLTECIELFGAGAVGGIGDGHKDYKKLITVAIGKSVTMLKPDSEGFKFLQQKQVLIADECHVWGSSQLEKVCHEILGNVPYRFFMSATIKRGDGGLLLLQSIVGPTVLNMTVKEGINQGYLCPLRFKILSVISPSSIVKKDPLETKRLHLLYNPKIAELAAKVANTMWLARKESTLILVEELSQISMIKDLITVPFSYVHAGSKQDAEEWGLNKVDKQVEIERFNSGEVKVLVGTSCISCGVNIYSNHHTIDWMGGASEIDTFQGPMGRSTRKLELSKYKHLHKPKPFCIVYDFNVLGQPILSRHLNSRIECYEESGGPIERF